MNRVFGKHSVPPYGLKQNKMTPYIYGSIIASIWTHFGAWLVTASFWGSDGSRYSWLKILRVQSALRHSWIWPGSEGDGSRYTRMQILRARSAIRHSWLAHPKRLAMERINVIRSSRYEKDNQMNKCIKVSFNLKVCELHAVERCIWKPIK